MLYIQRKTMPKDDFEADKYLEQMQEAERKAAAEEIAAANKATEEAKKALDRERDG
jgi:hypothetical protein